MKNNKFLSGYSTTNDMEKFHVNFKTNAVIMSDDTIGRTSTSGESFQAHSYESSYSVFVQKYMKVYTITLIFNTIEILNYCIVFYAHL